MPARGVSLEQDSRFKNKEEELLKSTKFPSVFSSKVDMSKVSLPVLRPWIEVRVEQMMGFEDDVLVEFVMGLLEQEQISLTGFLEKRAAPFMNELWHHLVSAQASVGGVPRAFVEQKKREMQAMRDETTSLAQRVRLPSRDERGPPSSRRWDRGRSPVRNRPRHGDAHEFVDKRGNVTRRERDAGWVGARHLPQGPRAGRAPTEDPRDTYDEFGRDTAYRRAHERHTHGYADERSRDARREGDIWSSPASRSYRDGRHHSTYRDETPPPGPGRRRDEARSPLPAGAATPVYTRGDTTPVYPRGDATPRYERGDTTPRYARDDSPQYSPPPP